MAGILVVDDEAALLDLLGNIVQELDYEAIAAVNGREAWETLSSLEELHALIITDLMMPVMDGIQFIRRERSDPHLQYIPVILMSAAACPPLELDIDAFVTNRSISITCCTLFNSTLNRIDLKRLQINLRQLLP